MRRVHFNSIKHRILFWLLLLSIIPLITTLTISFFERVNAIKEREFEKLIAIRDLKVNELNNWITERQADLKVISEDMEIRNLESYLVENKITELSNYQIKHANDLLTRYMDNFSSYQEIFIVNIANGRIILSTDEKSIGLDKSNEEYFINAKTNQKSFIQDIRISPLSKQPEMYFSNAIICMTHGEHNVGVLVARINLYESLYKLLSNNTGLGKTGETLIINKDSLAVNDLNFYKDAPLNLKITAEPAMNAIEGKTGIIETFDYDNQMVLAAYTYIPQTKWGFVAKQNLSELYLPIKKMNTNFILLILTTIIVIVIAALKLSKTITKPLIKINDTAKRIGRGDYSSRMIINSSDEVGSLAEEFNNMANKTESILNLERNTTILTKSMIGRTSQKNFAKSLLKQLMQISDAKISCFYIHNEDNKLFEAFESIGAKKELLESFSAENPEGEFANVISSKSIFYHKRIPDNKDFNYKTVIGELPPKEIISIPIIVNNKILAIISLINTEKFKDDVIELLRRSWTNINVIYSNLIANEHTKQLASSLSTINQKLEAQSEELQEQSEELQEQNEELEEQSEELRITADKLHNQNITLEQQKRQVESANKLKSEFLSNMSHELRTPLNSILTLTHVLLLEAKSKLEEEEYSYLEIVHRNGKNLLEIINSILDLSKIEAGRMDIHTNRFSFKQMLSMVNENLQPLAKEKGIDYKIIFDEHIPKINSDELKLHQVFTNIIGNAIKFTESGFVEIKTRVEDKSIITSIKDTGIGISKNDLHDIFDEFHQSDGTSSRKYEGTGLGLAIARKLITMLGGELTAESEKGVGSIFTIKVPIEWHNKDAYTAPFSDKLTNNITSSNYINDFSERKILLVDDNEDIIKQMTGLLENLNINLEVAIGGEQALKLIDMSIPDGIILDLMMPSIDGFEVLKTISINQKTKNIPIIILTAKDLSKNDLKKLEFANIQFIVQKGDIYQKDLIDKVKHILSLKNERTILNPEYKKQKNKKVNIYIISEQKDNLISISALLKNNYNIIEITDSDGKFNKIATNGNNIILVDTPPESLHKNEYLEKFIPNEKIIPYAAIVLSARAMKGDKDMYLSLGYDEYVSLPIDYDNLALKIDNLL